ncbi:Pvc16 family protein [Labedaea rhizosphaerae]|uniref:Uncharacterized protein DUF4255 n=1 Tax=Labedaea rhizosphaerae TaxID=598644 RepID=A0A4R6SJG0_LABRH|nr:Pvc16 family protein [Labedaea rhizosphaerae]TDQ01138.1 uncharacterized protein DUF4255 [Labedaea rhizosphaerae]
MLHDVDTVVRSMLAEALPAGTAVRFDPPDPAWRAGGEAVGALLYRVVEDLAARAAAWSDVRDGNGRVTARVPVSRRYQLTYLLTAWAADVEREHALLGMALAGLGVGTSVPEQHLHGGLHDVALAVASPEFAPAPLDLWSALGIPPRASIELVLTAPVPMPVVTELAPAPAQVDLGIAGSRPPDPEPVRSVPPPRGRITESPA